MTKQRPMVNVGVDVSKSKLDVYLLERDLLLSVPNDEQAIATLISRLALGSRRWLHVSAARPIRASSADSVEKLRFPRR
jgi:hypothetical protein